MAKQELQETIAKLGLAVKADFVPFSQSRNAKPNPKLSERSLNWRVTLQRDGRDVLATDYSAGIAHCPSYTQGGAMRPTIEFDERIGRETETGKAAIGFRKAILPDPLDVINSLVLDADVLNYSGFEDWAESFGYDSDSRKAEASYRACVDIALKLRNGIGEDGLAALAEAAQDY